MAQPKTQPTKASVQKFIAAIDGDARRRDCQTLAAMMTRATGHKPVMWGPSIVGFGECDYPGASGRSTRWFEIGFSPRKAALTLYLLGGFDREVVGRMAMRSSAGGCLYVRSLENIDRTTLQRVMNDSVRRIRANLEPRT
jgi:hypothetical protein